MATSNASNLYLLLERSGEDIIYDLLSYLYLEDLYELMLVSKTMLQVCTSEALWKAILDRDFNGFADERGNDNSSMKTYQNNLYLNKLKKECVTTNTASIDKEIGAVSVKYNVAALCMRDELKNLQSALEPSEVNVPVVYRSWVYLGNFSSAVINAFILYNEESKIYLLDIERGRDPGRGDVPKELWATPLHWACLGDNLDVVKYLCSIKGIDLEPRIAYLDATPLDIAIKNGYIQLAKYLTTQINNK